MKFRRFCLILLVVAFLGAGAIAIFDRDVRDRIQAIGYQPSSELSTVINNLTLTPTGSRILYATRPELLEAASFNQECPTISAQTSTLGCYYRDRVYVFNVKNSELDGVKEAVLAHELLHAVWNRASERERDDLRPLLEQTYQAHLDVLSEHMENYDVEDYADELHSVIGTQIDPSALDPTLQDHYAKFFTRHQTIVSYFAAYNTVLESERQAAQQLYDQIAAKKTEIDQRSAAYKEASDQLAADIESFNVLAANPRQSFSSMAEFYQARDALVARQQSLQTEYESLSKLVDETNALVDKYNDSVVRVGELFESLQSNIQAPQDSF